jgi:glycosyltransferase involved in cell wall biosynthesis
VDPVIEWLVPDRVQRRLLAKVAAWVKEKLLVDLNARTDLLVLLLEQRVVRLEREIERKARRDSEDLLQPPLDAEPTSPERPRPRLFVVSPLPPTRSGIADYVVELAPHLSRHFELVHVIDDDAPEPIGPARDFEVIRVSKLLATPALGPQPPRLLHLGNSLHHSFVHRALEASSSGAAVAVLHEPVQHHAAAIRTFLSGDRPSYVRMLSESYGEAGAVTARLRHEKLFSGNLEFHLPLTAQALSGAAAVVVHSPTAAASVAAECPGLPIGYIPHHASSPPEGLAKRGRAQARESLDLAADELVLLSLGQVTPPKQIDLCLRALARVRHRLPPFKYCIVGERSPEYPVVDRIRALDLESVVRVTGHEELERLHDFILASDVVINLRHPTAGETSGTLLRAMARGRPVIVFDHGAYGDMPDDAVVKLPLEVASPGPLAAVILELANDPDRRERVGRAAALHVRAEHPVERCAAHYAAFLRQITAQREERCQPKYP